MTYGYIQHIADLQTRNTELVSQNRILERVANDRGPAISAVLRAYHKAIEKHQEFPKPIDSQGIILVEELLEMQQELNAAVLAVVQAINDNRDEAPCLDRVREELDHTGGVVLRMRGRLS